MNKNIHFFDDIYVLDGSTDKTAEIISKLNVNLFLEKDNEHDPYMIKQKNSRGNVFNSARGFLLQKIKEKYLTEESVWVHLMHSDEIFYHDPRKVAIEADKEGADFVSWYCMHFFLHTSDKSNWNELKKLPAEERVTWYSYGCNNIGKPEEPWRENISFKLKKETNYDIGDNKIEPSPLTKRYSLRPIYKHFNMHNADRVLDERGRMGKNHGSGYFVDVIKDKSGNFNYSAKFDGSFGKWEIGTEHLK
jgi:hypothetical protein